MTYKTYEVRVYRDGAKYWYQNGKRHREDGPAVEGAKGTKCWYRNGLLHREDGPAIEYADGTKEWYLEGTHYTEAEFLRKVQSIKNPYELTISEIETILGFPVKIIKGP